MDLLYKNTKYKKLFVFFLCLQCWVPLSAAFSQAYIKPTLSAGDVRFAKERCQDLFTAASEDLKFMWSRNEFPDNNETHCYIKCLLYKLGLIDIIGRGLNGQMIAKIWSYFDSDIVGNCLVNFALHEDLDDKCLSYYNKWTNLHMQCPILAKLTFFEKGYEKGLGTLSDSLPRSKEQGISATEFCASFRKADEVSLMTYYKCKWDCVFRHFYYFDAYGRLDESEILRSFDEVNFTSSENSEVIKKCTHSANMKYDGSRNCEMAFELKNCLWQATKDFSKVYIQRDTLSRHY